MAQPHIQTIGSGVVNISGSGTANVKELTFSVGSLSGDPTVPSRAYNIQGDWKVCTPERCPTNVTGAVEDSDGYLRYTTAQGTRYVWYNEHGYKMAINSSDQITNIYDATTEINTGQSGRIGFTGGGSIVVRLLNGVTNYSTTVFPVWDNGLNIRQNL